MAQDGERSTTGLSAVTCLFNLYAELIMRNVGLNESQDGIKIGRRNINNRTYMDNTILLAKSEGELKSLLMMLKEDREKAGFKKTQHPKN